MPSVIFVLVALTAVAVVSLAMLNHRQTIAQWTEAATQLGLDLNPGGMFSSPRMDGLISGLVVSVHTITKGSGNNQQRYTRFQVEYPSIGFEFELSRQTKVGGFFRRMVGMQDVEIGDPSFDDAFVVKTNDRDRMSAYLTGQRRMTLHRLLATYPILEVRNTGVRVDVRRIIRDSEVLISSVRRLAGVGQSLSGNAGDLDEAVLARESGDLGEALGRMRAAVESQPDDVERRLTELDTLAAAGNVAELEERVRELENLAPADPEVLRWKGALAAQPARPSEQSAVDTSGIEAAAATADLFGGREMSFVIRDRFAAGYAGKRVRWSGVVKKARSYDFDPEFGRGPGIKAVVTVASLEHDLFGSTEVDAIVQLPGSVVPEKGSMITFEGTLIGADALMRNFTVEEATLLGAAEEAT
ncbi:MAG: hypothetical protein P1T08_14400 [Acidimicrobiia bacterium]|nr:hypothetical protein [Acidimicrobiia bacterium]